MQNREASPLEKTPFDDRLDLQFERIVNVPAAALWRGWTKPDDLKQWFCPLPWRVVDCKIDLRPGGIFHTNMQGPDGETHVMGGCYLELVENRRLVWTNALGPFFRPQPLSMFAFTAFVTFDSAGAGTRYRAVVIHKDEADRKAHEEMGFEQGWSVALDQLVALAKGW